MAPSQGSNIPVPKRKLVLSPRNPDVQKTLSSGSDVEGTGSGDSGFSDPSEFLQPRMRASLSREHIYTSLSKHTMNDFTPIHSPLTYSVLRKKSRRKHPNLYIDLPTYTGYTIHRDDTSVEPDKMSYQALIRASINVAQVLIDNGSDVNMQDDHGKSALMVATKYNYPQMVQLLLDKGAQVNMQDIKGYTALSIATEQKSTEIIKQLLGSGAEVDHVDNEGFSPLMLTCCDDQFEAEVAELLLANGANIDLQNNNGTSSLIMATQKLHMKQITFLLQHGALINIQDNQGLSPLMIACKQQFMQPIDLLIKYGAQIDLQDKDGKSALLHAVSNKCILDLTSHLIKLGAQVNLQDNSGWFPLMYAVKAEDLEAIQLLVANGAHIELRNCNGQTIFDVCPQHLINLPFFQELFQKLMRTVNNNDLRIDQNFPEIVFYKAPISKHITSSGATIDRLQDLGISISVPEGSLSPSEEPLDLHIHPCFCGPFRLPQEYESASPAYLIHHSKKTSFQKDITIRIHHHASIGSEEDCEEMAFLSASSTPEYIESHQDKGVVHPVYTFKKIHGGANTKFRPGDQVGEISLRHFCIVKTGKQRGNDCLYSVQLYRNVHHNGGVFCICPYSRIYIKHCDKVIIRDYSGLSKKGEGKSQFLAQIVGDSVTLLPNSNNSTSSVITFDRPSSILKREIHLPEILKIKVSKLLDYPPRIRIIVDDTRSEFSCDYPEVQVNGLDIPCSLPIFTQPLHPTLQQPSPMEVQGAMVVTDGGELKVAVSSTLMHYSTGYTITWSSFIGYTT